MKCDDKQIMVLLLEMGALPERQAITCLEKCDKPAFAVLRKMALQDGREAQSYINQAKAEFIIKARKREFVYTGQAKLCSYIIQIAKNLWSQFSRKNKFQTSELVEHDGIIHLPKEPENGPILIGLDQLSASDREILIAFYFYDHPLEEYAQQKNITASAARQRIKRARERLRTILNQ